MSCSQTENVTNELNISLQQSGKNTLLDSMLISRTTHILPAKYQTLKTSCMSLSDEKQSVNVMVNQLFTSEHDFKAGAVGRINVEALMAKPNVQNLIKQEIQAEKKAVK
jgi:hypothetical protein